MTRDAKDLMRRWVAIDTMMDLLRDKTIFPDRVTASFVMLRCKSEQRDVENELFPEELVKKNRRMT